MSGDVNKDGTATFGDYQIQMPVGIGQTVVVDEGTFTVTKQ